MSKQQETKQSKISAKPETVAKPSKKGAVELSSEDLTKVTGGAQVDFRKAG
ncbi:MAG: hypothetical protein ACHQF3_07775 [Alphaproteobacteria bacterium]